MLQNKKKSPSKSPVKKVPIHERLYTQQLKKCEVVKEPEDCKNDCILEDYTVSNRMLIFKKLEDPPVPSSKLSFIKTLRVPKVTEWKSQASSASKSSKSMNTNNFQDSPVMSSHLRTPKKSIKDEESSFVINSRNL